MTTLPPGLRVYPTFALMYKIREGRPSKNLYNISQEDRKVKGNLSEISKRKMRHAINTLVLIADKKKYYTRDGIPYTFKINFITLTLPVSQSHTDYELKTLLNDWLKYWHPKGLRSYVWKAEKQKNGNIHFHLTTDFYIHWEDIRKSWNKTLAQFGYIKRYREVQQEWHKEGFHFRPNTFRNVKGKRVEWSFEQQKQAYIEGKKTNWSNPNSTDVHATKSIDNLAAYMLKYMTKEDDVCNSNSGNSDDGRLQGRLWACSRNLRLKPEDLMYDEYQIVYNIFNDESLDKHKLLGNIFEILPFNRLNQSIKDKFQPMLQRFKDYVLTNTS